MQRPLISCTQKVVVYETKAVCMLFIFSFTVISTKLKYLAIVILLHFKDILVHWDRKRNSYLLTFYGLETVDTTSRSLLVLLRHVSHVNLRAH